MSALIPSLPITTATFHLHKRLASATRQEAEEVTQSAVAPDLRQAGLQVCLAQAQSDLGTLKQGWQWVHEQLTHGGLPAIHLEPIVGDAIVVLENTEASLRTLEHEDWPQKALAATALAELNEVGGRFRALRDSLRNVTWPEPNRERIERGMAEMMRGEGEYVEDILARLQAGREP